MRGREVFMDSLVAQGVDRIFGNPGTTESPLLDSLAAYPNIRYVTALQESIALGAASFYAQASGKTGVVSLHVAPGLGNAIGMMYGALRANSPLVVTAGQQDTRMRLNDPVLGHDLVAMAAPVVKWSVQVERADEMASIMRRAFKIAQDHPKGPVFVGLPIDVMEQETEIGVGGTSQLHRSPPASAADLAEVAGLLQSSRRPVIVCGDDVARAGAVEALVELADLLGASVWSEGLRAQNSFPSSHASARLSLGLDAATIRKSLGDADVVLLLGGPFFEDVWYSPGSPFPPGAAVVQIEQSASRLAHSQNVTLGVVSEMTSALRGIIAALGKAPPSFAAVADQRRGELRKLKENEASAYKSRTAKAWSRDPISMPRAMAEVCRGMPSNGIVVDESITASIDLARAFSFAGAGDYFGGRGGGIGQGLAGAIGVQVAKPDRPVLCISGDGSAMYSIQALWTAAHCNLPIVFVVLVNREYRILKHNIDVYRQRFEISSQEPYAEMDLTNPSLGFIEMAAGMGVAGTRVAKADDIERAVADAFRSGKPHVVEIAIEAKR
jgi:benzoylformate decarboxylase